MKHSVALELRELIYRQNLMLILHALYTQVVLLHELFSHK